MSFRKKLFRKNADVVFDNALDAEHSDPKLYKKFLSDAAALGHVDAQLRFGLELVRGEFENENMVDGLKWIHLAAKSDKPEAWYVIGMMFKYGHLVSQNHLAASRIIEKAANLGHTIAQLELGYLYFEGVGVSQSDEKALELFRRAAENDCAQACFSIGLMYWDRQDDEEDLENAAYWMEKAQSFGNPRAKGMLLNIGEQQRIIKQNAWIHDEAMLAWNANVRREIENSSTLYDERDLIDVPDLLEDDNKTAKGEHQENQFSDLSTDEPLSTGHSSDEAVEPNPSLDHEMVSTSALGRIIGLKAKPFLFDTFLSGGYIERVDNRYYLTSLGRSAEVGGSYRLLENGGEVVIWPVDLGSSLRPLKQALLDPLDFRLYHMTHIDNLGGILEHGIFSHNTSPDYLDISNQCVNSRRERVDPVHKMSLHEYVPLYFNPRNAMLYATQAEYQDEIVIIEVAQRICLSNYTLFTERNAATTRCHFVYCLSDVREFNWPTILSRSWATDGVVNVDVKQLMMSECLVYGHVDTDYITAVHTVNTSMSSRLQSMLCGVQHLSIHSSPELFF